MTGIDYDDTIGYALQAGFDYGIDRHWLVNFDVKRYWLDTDVNVTSALGRLGADVDLDPWTIGIGVGYRF